MLKDFKAFLVRGNVVDLAVAVVVGAAFTNIVNALVKDFITPLIASVGGKPHFESLKFEVNHSVFAYGDFLNNVISFMIVAAVVFFLVVKPVNHLIKRMNRADAPKESKDPQLLVLEEIRDALAKRKA